MFSKRIIVVWMTPLFGFLLNHSSLFAQQQPAGFGAPLPPALNQTASPDAAQFPQLPGDDAEIDPGFHPRTQMEQEEQEMKTANSGPTYTPQIQPPPEVPAAQSTVSAAQLRHPLSRKGQRVLLKLESYLKLGQRAKARQQLAKALKDPSAAPYAHAIVGTEYLKEGQPGAAVPELENAAGVLSMAAVHSNLGYALCLTGHSKRGEQELEEALRLDGNSAHARFLLGVLLLNEKSREAEAHYDLNMAQADLRTAHLALAVYHLRRGEKDAAEKQVHEFLGAQEQNQFPKFWDWACRAAEQPNPAAAFGFKDTSAD